MELRVEYSEQMEQIFRAVENDKTRYYTLSNEIIGTLGFILTVIVAFFLKNNFVQKFAMVGLFFCFGIY